MNPDRLGPYPIEREVGRGGMGVVYLGRDPRLDRAVAIKVLPDAFAKDPDRLARFEREARLLASLSHPNIAGIHGLEESNGQRFLVLEYVEGETLAERLQRGPLPLEEALDVCRQIAGALEAAHEAGIVHRDLKPANVKLTPTGSVKVLDFGLSKGGGPAVDSAPDLTQSPTMTYAMTGVGTILGTAAYMSPEQARGKPVDRRTDIWSFGCVLYECLTGKQAFEGETASDLVAMILQGEPDWSRIPAGTPEKVRQLLGRCLERDAKQRLRDIGDARIEIEELQGSRVSRASAASGIARAAAAAPIVRRVRPAWQQMVIAALVLLAGGAAGALVWSAAGLTPTETPPFRFAINAPPRLELTNDPNELAISPDGRTLAFVAVDSTSEGSLWLRPLGSFEARELPGTRKASLPFWSPDGKQLGFFADGKLKRIRVAGGSPEVICDAATGRGATWNRKNVIVFSPSPAGPLYQVRASGGGQPEAVTVVDSAAGQNAHRWPCFLPDGEHFTYAALPIRKGMYSCFVGSLGSKQATPLLEANGAPIYAAPGYLIFTRNEALVAQRFDMGRKRVTGDLFTIGSPPATTTYSASPGASVSANGVLAWHAAGKLANRLVWVDRNGREIRTVSIAPDRWSVPLISPDGRKALIAKDLATGAADLWVVDLEREVANRLTFGQGKNFIGTWSPDGREVLYGSTRDGPRDVYRRAADGSGADQAFHRSNVPYKDATSWSPDGKWVVVQEIGDDNGWNLVLIPAAGGSPVPFLVTPFNEQFGNVSPDGRWILYLSDESGTSQAYVQSFPTPGKKQQISRTGAFYADWAGNGREVFLLRPDGSILSSRVTPGPEPTFAPPQELYRFPQYANGWAPAPDGQRFLMTVPAERVVPGISVAVNWRGERQE